jgi:hypothetical protein
MAVGRGLEASLMCRCSCGGPLRVASASRGRGRGAGSNRADLASPPGAKSPNFWNGPSGAGDMMPSKGCGGGESSP